MPDIIQLLPDSIANQIAAGEVVQRPSSVVKELLENSVDAGSTAITLNIVEAGKTLIQVIDDGIGMSETDARMCFERHATSKIRTSEDLFKIKTMGFRGEAMASIAAVSRVELKSKNSENELGTFIIIEASEVKKQEHIAQKRGTSLAVKNLFYNVPARRNFLKSNAVELRHIIDEFQRIALSNAQITFTMIQNDIETYHLPAGKLSQRIVSLFGKNYQQQLIACQEETHWLKVTGYIGKPEFAKKTRGEQYFFINNRFIKSNYLHHAVQGAFEGLIKEDQFPFYALFIELDPIHIDINVHPTKTEVKFDDERSVYGIIRAAVKQALGAHNVTPALDFGTDVNFEHLAITPFHTGLTPSRAEKSYGNFKTLDEIQGRTAKWQDLYQSALKEATPTPDQIRQEEMAGFDNARFAANSETENTSVYQESIASSSSAPFLLHDRYIVKQVKSGVMLLDIRLAFERVLFEKYLSQLKSGKGITQKCLFPVNVDLNPADFAMVMELKEEISDLGFDFEEFGKSNIAINGVPADIRNVNEKELFEGLIEQFKQNKSELTIDIKENLARSIAKRSANKTKIGQDSLELRSLIDRLFGCEQPNYTPGGRPTFIILAIEKIEDFFNH